MSMTTARCNHIARESGEHCHEFPQLILGWRGEMDYEAHGGGCRIRAGDVAIVPRHETHLYAGRQDQCALLVIDIDLQDPCLSALEDSCNLPLCDQLFEEARTLHLPPSLTPLIEFSTRQLMQARPGQRRMLDHQLACLFVGQIHQLLDTPAPSARPARFSPAQLDQLIDERLATPPDNRMLAEALHVSQSQLHHLSLQELGVSPQQYVLRRRLRWAHHWLSTSTRSVSAIADALGFAETSSFSRAFKREFGRPPSHSRRR